MFFNKKKKEEKQFIENVKFPEGFESFLREQHTKQDALADRINEEVVKIGYIQMTNGMAPENIHKLFKERYLSTKKTEEILSNFYEKEKLMIGTSFYFNFYGFIFYDPDELRKIALKFLPSMKLIPFAIHGGDSNDGVLCLDYSENESEPSILYYNIESNKMMSKAAKNFKEIL